jgi:superfamily II DNA or RNA helicase
LTIGLKPAFQHDGDSAAVFKELRFRYPFRRYQQMVLDVVGAESSNNHQHHLVAPPGSGKTIVGLELIRRFGRPAVVFAPTTTIQKQWQEKAGLFCEDPEWIERHTSLDPLHLAEINVLTYQVLSTPGENIEFVERIAIERWVDDLLESGQAATEARARQRLATLETANPKAYRREISKRYRRIKREFLRDDTLGSRQFLHPNACALLDRIVALGTGTIVLDECHHLLDYWAFILRELIRSLPGVRVVGLTATLPDPSNQTEYENYTSLLGSVDFEVPTPAVVKEGNLAPYRDLVYFCEPSPREQDYLDRIQRHFETAVWQVSNTDAFRDWLWGTLFPSLSPGPLEPGGDDLLKLDGPEPWSIPGETGTPEPVVILASFEAAFRSEPLLCISAVKYLLELGVYLPLYIPLIEEMLEPLGMDDWLVLMENYALRALKISATPEHQALYRDLRDALLPFGIIISERGVRHHRSPGDLVLALSESKDQATARILRAEAEAMGGKLRAVVLTDFERMSARTRRLKGILDPDAGSAVRVFRLLVSDPFTEILAPILVTGKVVLASARSRALLEGNVRRWVKTNRASFEWEWRKTSSDQVLRLVGSGPEWSSRTYVALVTDLFERGITRCLVGTRGIFGEGWDTLSLNTLIDLTSVTTRTAVQQIRGRSVRLDPSWPRKVAHNWDVVCVSPRYDRGSTDLRRFMARHEHTWGLVTGPKAPRTGKGAGEAIDTAGADEHPSDPTPAGQYAPLQPAIQGRVVRGVAHVDLELASELSTREFSRVRYPVYTRRMVDAVWDRGDVYDLWGIGQPYENLIYSVTSVRACDLRFRTTHTVTKSLRTIVWGTLTSALAAGGAIWVAETLILPWAMAQSLLPLGAAITLLLGIAVTLTLAINGWLLGRAVKQTFLELPADAILLDLGRALLAALCDVGTVSPYLDDDRVRVVEMPGGSYEIFVADADPEDSFTFSRAYQQMLGPLGDARYLIERDSSTLRNLIYRPLWLLARKAFRLEEDLKAYHRVPNLLATHRQRAESLSRHWQEYVGGGRLIYTRTAEGRRILLQARAQNRKRIRQTAFEIWH